MQASLYRNPMFATGLSSLLQSFVGNPREAAMAELYASEAGLNNDTRRYREAIGAAGESKDLAGLLTSALQGGYGAAAPGIASALASTPEYGFDPQTQAQIQVGTGTQSASGTFPGLADQLENAMARTGMQVQGQKDIAGMKIDADAALAQQGFETFKGALDGYVGRLGQIESGWNGGAQNPTSSAGGYFQWTDDTARQYGVNKGDLDSEMAGLERFTLDNASTFKTMLGREPTEAELYLMHQQGAGGATKLLANPGALAVDVVGRDAVVNNGGNEGMTAGQFAQHVMGYYGGGGGGGGGDLYSMLLAAGTPGVSGNQSRILGGLANDMMDIGDPVDPRTLSAGSRSALLDALGEDVDPTMGMSIVSAAEALLQQHPSMTENEALAYAVDPDNHERGPSTVDESWMPFGIGDEEVPGPITGLKRHPGAAPAPQVGNPNAAVIAEARAAIAAGAPREAVLARLAEMGIDPTGL